MYALLLDALGIDRAAVFGYSGGGPAAIQFALRRTGRTTVLILMASALPGKAGAPLKALAQALFGSERLLWILKSYAPSLFARILGMPKGFHPTPGERGRIEQTMDSLFPVHPRKRGVLFDLYVSNPDVQAYPLQEITVPTLIINARDDGLSAFDNAARAAGRIRRSRLLANRPRRASPARKRGSLQGGDRRVRNVCDLMPSAARRAGNKPRTASPAPGKDRPHSARDLWHLDAQVMAHLRSS